MKIICNKNNNSKEQMHKIKFNQKFNRIIMKISIKITN